VHLPQELGCYDAKSTDYFICGERFAPSKVAKHWLLCLCVWSRGVLCFTPLGRREREQIVRELCIGLASKRCILPLHGEFG
jgi:hypothetical protein